MCDIFIMEPYCILFFKKEVIRWHKMDFLLIWYCVVVVVGGDFQIHFSCFDTPLFYPLTFLMKNNNNDNIYIMFSFVYSSCISLYAFEKFPKLLLLFFFNLNLYYFYKKRISIWAFCWSRLYMSSFNKSLRTWLRED